MRLPFPSSTTPSKVMILIILFMLLSLSSLLAHMTVKGGTNQACAACKFRRRKCRPDCALAPFFPADKPKMFQNAHRLYGVSNITKILEQLARYDQKEDAIRSIVYESNMRQRFPVHGCYGIICQLHQQLRQSIEELDYVKTRIAFCKDQIQEQTVSINQQQQHSPSSHVQLGTMPTISIALPICPQYHFGVGTAPAPNQFLVNGFGDAYVENIDDMVKTSWAQHPCFNDNNSSLGIQSPIVVSQAVPCRQDIEVCQDYDGIPFDTIADDRQSYIESNEPCESSAESSLRDTLQTTEDISKNELRNAAACFSLTNVN